VVQLGEDLFLKFNVLDLLEVNNVRFGDLFKSQDLFKRGQDLLYTTESACP
jgi:hypothetical protein